MTRQSDLQELGALTRAVLALSGCSDALAQATHESDLLGRVCAMLVQTCGYRLAWVGYRCDDAEKTVAVQAAAGFDADYTDSARITWADGPRGHGPTGTAIRTGRCAVAQNITANPSFAPWREQALARGYNASIAVPLRVDGEVLGALNVYATEPNAFDAGEIKLLERMTSSVGAGLSAIRTRAEAQAKAELLQAVWNASPDMLFLHGADGRMLAMSEGVERLMGRSAEEMMADPTALVGSDRTVQEAMAHVQWVADNAEPRDLDWTGRDRDGNDLPLEVRLRPLSLQAEDGPRVLALVRDLTDQRKVERERMDIERLEALATLAGGIAHDFNNLLTGIVGNLELARTAASIGERDLSLSEAEEAALRASSLTRQLLTFARGTTTLPAVLDVAALVERTARFSVRGSAAALEVNLPDDLWPIMADEGQITQVVQNLVLNAVQAMPDGGTVRIDARNCRADGGDCDSPADGDCVRVLFSDSGPGIPEEVLPRVFDPWVTTKPGGSGLGLAASFSIVRRHGGRLMARNRPQGGACFEVCIPRTQTDRSSAGVLVRGDHRRRLMRVLVMDDEPSLRRLVKRLLQQQGHRVEVAADGAEAIQAFRRARDSADPFELLVLDLTVPGGMGGQRALHAIRSLDPDVLALAMSGYSESSVEGFQAFLPKPFGSAGLMQAIETILSA